ncbi:AAA family ATPase [Proteus mirabilis]
MINRIKSRNYKAFKEFDFEIKPLTILLGANSCGKSSLINAILMFSQTCESLDIAELPLRLNGSRVGLGEAINIVRDKNTENKLSFSIYFDEKEKHSLYYRRGKHRLKFNLIRFYASMFGFIMRRIVDLNSDVYLKYENLLTEYDDFFYPKESDIKVHMKILCEALTEVIPCYRDTVNKRQKLPRAIQYYFKNMDLKEFNYLVSNFDNISSEDKTKVCGIRYDFNIQKNDGFQEIIGFALLDATDNEILSISKRKNKGYYFKSDVFKIESNDFLVDSLNKKINFNSLYIIDRTNKDASDFPALNDLVIGMSMYIEKYISLNIETFIREFNGNKINHVSPLRAFPQRYYLLDKSIHHEQLDALNGIELAEILKKNKDILDKVNLLFAKFNIYISIQKTNDIIHRIVVNQDSVELELTDVGFGISQVLPILVQAYLSPRDSITIIEQPEIHLNPKMQAWLTDALILISLNEKKKFIIETHSETLIRRLRLRIVDTDSNLTPDDLLIYHLERDDEANTTTLNKANVNNDGDIIWPKEFMDINIQDILEIQKMKFELKNKGMH